jgi:hypothetical protein
MIKHDFVPINYSILECSICKCLKSSISCWFVYPGEYRIDGSINWTTLELNCNEVILQSILK